MDDASPSISEILQRSAWKHALFTTYTLSLSYFESEILPSLIRGGCSDIWLIADAEGYRSSLLERRSMRVGHEYRLIPVALPDGVFHAKSIYLSGDEGDLLLVGSGNVTFAGHGRNLEIFEALTPDFDGPAFADFAGYLEALRARKDIAFARTEWIDDFAARAVSASGSGKGSVRLLHSLNSPIIQQLPSAMANYGSCAAVTIMSPYHDPDGLAIERLSDALGAVPISVAVTGAKSSPFPFADASAWDVPVTAVQFTRRDKRFVHAKLYEFSCAEQDVILSGSINATHKALETTENVELGVLRALPSEEGFLNWKTVKPPPFEAQTRMPSGLKENEIVYASFDRNDTALLTGQIISLQPMEGRWSGRLVQADGDTASFEADIDQHGRFSHKATKVEPFSEMPALQLVMTRGDREARGWVHNEMFLSMSGRRGLTAGSLSRLMRREGSDDDIEALLDYLSVHAENHLRIFDLPICGGETKKAEGSSDVISVNLAALAPIEDVPRGREVGAPGGHGHVDAFDVAMQRLRKVFLGHGRSPSMAASSFGESIVAEEDTEQGSTGETVAIYERERRGLSDFESQIDRLTAEAKDAPGSVRALLVLKLEVGMWMRIYRLNEPDDAHEFLAAWFYQACSIAEPEAENISSLEQHLVTSAATVFALAETDRKTTALRLHDSLEHFYRGDIDPSRFLDALVAQSDVGFAALLLGEKATNECLKDALTEIISHPTTRQQLIATAKC